MDYYSLNGSSKVVGFREAVIEGLAKDNGLYFPRHIEPLDSRILTNPEEFTNTELAYGVIRQFVGDDISPNALMQILEETLSFDFPVIDLESDVYALELFHGPTLAFKDVGARFMARCLAYFNSDNPKAENVVLVATSGDTGGAVANGFLNVEGVKVVILFPNGGVSDIQERQLTTLGSNIFALKVNGTFDDCQKMVKRAFIDASLEHIKLTSANSINVARWLPQMLYFFFAYNALKHTQKPIVFSCPSGNFGNICAGVMAKKLGLPIAHFIAATNRNDTVPRFMETGIYEPRPSKPTISNAMDVGDPSNFVRILEIYERDINKLRQDFTSYTFEDGETIAAMRSIYESAGYLADPHGAVAYLGLKRFIGNQGKYTGVFLETAHPVKFPETIEKTLNIHVPIPEQLTALMGRDKISSEISSYKQLQDYLLEL